MGTKGEKEGPEPEEIEEAEVPEDVTEMEPYVDEEIGNANR